MSYKYAPIRMANILKRYARGLKECRATGISMDRIQNDTLFEDGLMGSYNVKHVLSI